MGRRYFSERREAGASLAKPYRPLKRAGVFHGPAFTTLERRAEKPHRPAACRIGEYGLVYQDEECFKCAVSLAYSLPASVGSR
jgi:hypothetical protein